MAQPDVAGDGPALRPDVPVEEQVLVAAATRRRRRRLAAGGSAVLVAAAALLASRADPDPARSPAAPAISQSAAATPPAWSPPEQVVDVAVGSDTLYALLGSCAGPEQARECGYRLMAQTRGGRWTRVPLPLPPPDGGTGFAARLLLTGDTLTVLDEPRGQAYVSEAGAPFAVREVRDGPPLPAGMPSGLVPELVAGRVTVFDPATGLRRPLAAQPRLEILPRDVVAGPFGDLWAVAEPGLRVVVGHSSDGGRSWRTAAVAGLRPGFGLLRLVPGQDGAVYLLGGREGLSGVGLELWWHPDAGGTWSRVDAGPRPQSVGSVAPGRSGLLLTDQPGTLWRLSPDGSFERLPDPVVDGAPVRAGSLFSGPGGRMISRPTGSIGGALLLVSADDGDSWLPTLVPG